jgi:hypothetical protein
MNALTNPTDQKNCSHSRLANDDFLSFFFSFFLFWNFVTVVTNKIGKKLFKNQI